MQRPLLPRSPPPPLLRRWSTSSSSQYGAEMHTDIFLCAGASSLPHSVSRWVGVLTLSVHRPLILPYVARAQHLVLFLHARSLLSAAVRMNNIGPYLAQQTLLRDIRPLVDGLATQCGALRANRSEAMSIDSGPASSWPLGEIIAIRHDLQHSRIFNS